MALTHARWTMAICSTLSTFAPVAAQEVSGTVFESAVLVSVSGTATTGEQVTRTGSGFLVGPSGSVATSLHTVLEPNGGWATNELGIPKVQISVIIRDKSAGLLGTDVRPAIVLHRNSQVDVAILNVAGVASKGLSTCPDSSLKLGDSVIIAGIFREGPLSRVDTRDGTVGEARVEDAPFIRISARTERGFSGGPAFKRNNDGGYTLVGMLKGGESDVSKAHSLIVPLSAMRTTVLGACDVPCAHPDHGVERYRVHEEPGWHTSDWVRGGSDAQKYCDAYAGAERRGRADRVVSVVETGDAGQRFFTGWRSGSYIVRESQYKYRCRLVYNAEPVYRERISANCPAAPNPLNLPR